jgi:very-short-patch-repair endonuclease
MAYDWERAQYAQRRGYRVIRVWSPDVQKRFAAVLKSIVAQAGVVASPVAHESMVA